MKKLILVLSISLIGCKKNEVNKTFCWEITTTCDYLGDGKPTISTDIECGGTELDMKLLALELEKYGCIVKYKKK